MELTPYVEALRQELATAAAAGTEDTRRTADLLGAALDSSVRLVIMDALSQAAAEITAALPDSSVEVRLRGRDPEVVVSSTEPADVPAPSDAVTVESDADTVRITLRLPGPLKTAAEEAASRTALSVNAWLVRAVQQALTGPGPRRSSSNRSMTGWAQA